MRGQFSVDARSFDLTAQAFQIQTAVYQVDAVEASVPRDSQRVLDARGLVLASVSPERVIVFWILRADRDRVVAGIDLYLRFVEPLLAPCALDRIDLHLVAIPCRDVHRTINVLQFDAPA